MESGADFSQIPTTIVADLLGRGQVMDISIRALWSPVRQVAGPALTVRCAPGDNLMLHAAIYRADPGSVLVVEAGDSEYAVAGGNVCAVAQRHGISALIVDGVIRDVAEVRASGFPVFARGVVPVAGVKTAVAPLNTEVRCGGVIVAAGDIVVADEDGVMVIPANEADQVLRDSLAKLQAEAAQSLDEWEAEHRARVAEILADRGFES